MLCNVILLRWHGNWMSRERVTSQGGMPGVLDFRKANRAHYGNTMQARLLSIKDPQKDLLPVLQYARVLTIKEGGVLIDGVEISTRGVKSKPIQTQADLVVRDRARGRLCRPRANGRSQLIGLQRERQRGRGIAAGLASVGGHCRETMNHESN